MCSLVKMQGICCTAGCASGNLGACRSRVSWNLLVVGDIAYAKSGETQIAYRVIGEAGRVDVIMVAGALFPFELLAEDRVASRFTAGLAALGRVLVFDKRGVGLSDPMTDWSRSVQEQWAEDLVAVIEAAGLV